MISRYPGAYQAIYQMIYNESPFTNKNSKEIEKIEILEEDLRFQFEDSLIKKEIEILLQDINNYHLRYKIKNEKSETNELLEKLTKKAKDLLKKDIIIKSVTLEEMNNVPDKLIVWSEK